MTNPGDTVDDPSAARDALDGSPASERIVFGIDRRLFEIDLNAEHAHQLRTALAPFIEAGRYLEAMRIDSESPQIRAWGRRNGWAVSDHGRLPADLVHAYKMRRD